MTDWDLLDKYVTEGSREALGALIQRHVEMVNATARREMRDANLADDVTQAVFVVLMQRAKNLSRRVKIGGWLFKVTRFAAMDARKRAARQKHHEREASKMATVQREGSQWLEIEPVLNDAIGVLGKMDRDLVVMRYLEGRSIREIAEGEQATENAMRQRLMRSLQRLKKKLEDRGVTATAGAVEIALEGKPVLGVSPGLIESMAAIVSGARAPSATCDGIAKGVLKMMRKMKIQMFGGVVGVLIVALLGGYFGLRTAFADGTNAPAPAAPISQAAPATSSVAKSPAEVVRDAYHAGMMGDADALLAACDGLTAQQATMLKQLVPAMKAVNDLQQAVSDRFGANARSTAEEAMVGVNPADLQKAKEAIDGDTAVVDIGDSGPGKVAMVKVNGQWKISATTVAEMPPQMVLQAVKMVPLIQEIQANVKAGKYASVEEMQQAMQETMQKGLQGSGRQ